ncbi:hypothetical protein AN218_12180, partial [Streptomyces nanshensis]
ARQALAGAQAATGGGTQTVSAPAAGPSVAASASASARVPGPASSGAAAYNGAIEDDMPAEDDPDLDESALSGYDLIVRELGATVIEEVEHE